jgi:diketogulonate reductase-like aldo/keto reductase
MKNVVLNNGVKMPIFGFGVFSTLGLRYAAEVIENAGIWKRRAA